MMNTNSINNTLFPLLSSNIPNSTSSSLLLSTTSATTTSLPPQNNNNQPNSLYYYSISRQLGPPHAHARQAAQLARNMLKTNQKEQSTEITQNEQLQSIMRKHQKLALDAKDWSMMDLGGMLIHSLSSSLFDSFRFLTVLYLNHNQLWQIPAQISQLKNLIILDLSHNRLQFLPNEIGDLLQLREIWLFDNLLENLPWQMAFLRHLEMIGLEGNPMMKQNPYYQVPDPNITEQVRSMRYEHPLAEVLFREGAKGLVSWLRDQMPVDVLCPYQLPDRQWIQSQQEPSTASFTILSYNVLSERYATEQQYWYAPQWSLSFQHRQHLLMTQLKELDSDLICLQELDSQHYTAFFKPALCGDGNFVHPSQMAQEDLSNGKGTYQSVFLPKSRYKTMSEKARKATLGGVDGCAIFWRRSKWKRIRKPLVIEFGALALSRPDFEKCDVMFERFCQRDNVAVGVLLQSLADDSLFLVVNVHIHWDPRATDVKLVQTVILMEEIEKYLQKENLKGTPLLLCGDFNSLPQGLIYSYLSEKGGIKDFGLHPDLKDCFIDSAEEEQAETGSSQEEEEDTNSEKPKWKNWQESGYGQISKSNKLSHMYSGQLKSAYHSLDGVLIEGQNVFIPPLQKQSKQYPMPALPFTNHTAHFHGVIDYIWYSGSDFQVEAVLGGYFMQEVSRDLCKWIHESEKELQIEQGTRDSLLLPKSLRVWSIEGTRLIGFPNPVFPSDHLPVVSRMAVAKRKK